MIQSTIIPDNELNNKHTAVSYHYVWEANGVKIINPIWLHMHKKSSDMCTKELGENEFNGHIYKLWLKYLFMMCLGFIFWDWNILIEFKHYVFFLYF